LVHFFFPCSDMTLNSIGASAGSAGLQEQNELRTKIAFDAPSGYTNRYGIARKCDRNIFTVNSSPWPAGLADRGGNRWSRVGIEDPDPDAPQ
jgi:hypothetical protein